jgi:hypothetical protein
MPRSLDAHCKGNDRDTSNAISWAVQQRPSSLMAGDVGVLAPIHLGNFASLCTSLDPVWPTPQLGVQFPAPPSCRPRGV